MMHCGDKVKVAAFEGTVTSVVGGSGLVTSLALDVPGYGRVTLPESMAVRADPAGWPPLPGDIWVLPAGAEYFVRKSGVAGKEWTGDILIEGFDSDRPWFSSAPSAGWGRSLDVFLKLEPVLIRRRGE